MPLPVFPTRLFWFEGVDTDIEARTVSGGTSLAGEEDLIETDGGGRVTVTFNDADLGQPELAAAWRAITARGSQPIIVPLGDARHQMMGDATTPPERLPWWQEADFAGVAALSKLSAAASLRATVVQVDTSRLPRPVRAGIWCSIDHATWRHRAYLVEEVVSDTGLLATLKLRPPIREATASDADIEFVDPKCTMRRDGDMRSPVSGLYAAGQSVRFVEYPGAPA